MLFFWLYDWDRFPVNLFLVDFLLLPEASEWDGVPIFGKLEEMPLYLSLATLLITSNWSILSGFIFFWKATIYLYIEMETDKQELRNFLKLNEDARSFLTTVRFWLTEEPSAIRDLYFKFYDFWTRSPIFSYVTTILIYRYTIVVLLKLKITHILYICTHNVINPFFYQIKLCFSFSSTFLKSLILG